MYPFSLLLSLNSFLSTVDLVVNRLREQGESEGLQCSSTTRKYHLIDRLTYVCSGQWCQYFPPRQRSCGKVMFSVVNNFGITTRPLDVTIWALQNRNSPWSRGPPRAGFNEV